MDSRESVYRKKVDTSWAPLTRFSASDYYTAITAVSSNLDGKMVTWVCRLGESTIVEIESPNGFQVHLLYVESYEIP